MPDPRSESVVTVDFAPGVSLRRPAAATIVIGFGGRELTVSNVSEAMAGAVDALIEGVESALIHRRIEAAAGIPALAQWMGAVDRLEEMAALRYTLSLDGRPIIRFIPARRASGTLSDRPTGALRLSRFAYVRRERDKLVLDSPLASGAVELSDERALLALHELTDPSGAMDPTDWFDAMCGLLWTAGLVVSVDADGVSAEDRVPSLGSWEFADLLAHSRARAVRADQPIGGTYRLREVMDPLPALKPAMSEQRVPLPAPDLAGLTASDPPLAAVMEGRRSVRRHGTPPISLGQLGELLFRVARVRKGAGEAPGAAPFEVVSRVLPSGGGCHALEIYPIVGACEGLPPGLYHYDPGAHALEVLPGGAAAAGELLDGCTGMMDTGERPQVLLCVTARFRRVSWKYEGMAYAMVQKEVGVLYEALYLAATALRLAPCALGGGDTALVTRALALDPLEEGPVGEFVLGSLP